MTTLETAVSNRFFPAVKNEIHVEGFGEIVLSKFASRAHGIGIQVEVHRLGDETDRQHRDTYAMLIDNDLTIDWASARVRAGKSAFSRLENDIVLDVLGNLEEHDPALFVDMIETVVTAELADFDDKVASLSTQIKQYEEWLVERGQFALDTSDARMKKRLEELTASRDALEADFHGRGIFLQALRDAAATGDLEATLDALEATAEQEFEAEMSMVAGR